MSFYDDYVADGLCCQSCGAYLGNEPGYPQFCAGCDPERQQKPRKASARRSKAHTTNRGE